MSRVSVELSTELASRDRIIELVLSPTIEVTVNGKSKSVPPGQSISSLLTWLEIGSDRVAVELNKSIVRKRDWQQTTVSHGSQLEIVEFVGGG